MTRIESSDFLYNLTMGISVNKKFRTAMIILIFETKA
jgi:hypothetical protein